jgi:hypothetical protein
VTILPRKGRASSRDLDTLSILAHLIAKYIDIL